MMMMMVVVAVKENNQTCKRSAQVRQIEVCIAYLSYLGICICVTMVTDVW